MSKLLQMQFEFSQAAAKLIQQAKAMGFEVTLGEAWRPLWVAQEYARQGKGIAPSLHTERLAIDLNLFRNDGTFLSDGKEHAPLAAWWEANDPRARNGISFGDANHYSFVWMGRK